MPPHRQDLKRRLNRWQIFFIALGGIIGIGFFRGSSKSLAICGPVGALVAVIVVGTVATSVMECICELVVLWPIPNAMVEYVKAFVDEDLGVAVGVMYWYTYCVTFSALIIAATDLTSYWGISALFEAIIYVLVPIVLIIINACPVNVFGWVEFVGGVLKLALVVGTIILMFLVNAGVGPGDPIRTTYFGDGITHNEQVAASQSLAVFEAIPLATFAYIGIELLTTTAFEARHPDELRFPAANIGWFSTVLYAFATGSFVANVSWQDQNLPQLFDQALTIIRDPIAKAEFAKLDAPPVIKAAPLIALYRAGFRFLPGFLNGCFIYSALSCANTALYVASRQLYGMTRTLSADPESGFIRSNLAWISTLNHGTRTPWVAIAISGLVFCWLPFIRIRGDNDRFLQDVQDALVNIGSISCLLMWASQCLAYISFHHWRKIHENDLHLLQHKWSKLFSRENAGWFIDFQPFLGYFGAVMIIIIVGFFNSISLWNGKRLLVKAISAFVSPALVLLLWLLKKFSRRDGGRFRFFRRLSEFRDFQRRLQVLEDLIYPDEVRLARERRAAIDNIPLTGVAVEAQQPLFPRPISPDRTSLHARPGAAVFNRENLILTTADDNMLPRDDTPVSPLRGTELERPHTPSHQRSHSGSRSALRPSNNGYLSPASASWGRGSRRGMEDIHELDVAKDSDSPDESRSYNSGSSFEYREPR